MVDSKKQVKSSAPFTRSLFLRIVLVGALSAGIAIALGQLDFLKSFELRTLDMRFKWRPTQAIAPNLLLLAIDDADIQQLPWPWSRSLHAKLLSPFTNSATSVQAIAYNIVLSTPGVGEDGAKGDAALAVVLKELGNVCLAGLKKDTAAEPTGWNWLQPWAIAGETALDATYKPDHEIQGPAPAFREETHFGLINFDRDEDGVVRRIPMLIREGPAWIPSSALRAAMLYHTVLMDEVKISPGHEIILQRADGWKLSIPIDSDQQLRINYRGDIANPDHFNALPARAIFDWIDGEKDAAKIGEVLAQIHEGAVIVGITSPNLSRDISATPLNPKSPLVAVQLNALNNLLQGDFLRVTPLWATALITLFLGLLASFTTQRFAAVKGALIVTVLLALYLGSSWPLFTLKSVWLPWIVPTSALLLSAVVGAVARVKLAEKRTEKITDAFQSYVSTNLTREKLRGATSSQGSRALESLSEVMPEIGGSQITSTMIGLGKYNLLCKLGQGGMGAVFLGREKAKKRFCAVKVLNPQFAEDKDAIERFMREGRSMSGLTHANLVGLYDCDQFDGQYFIAMEFVEGLSLGDIIKEKGALPLPLALHWLKQASQGLEYIHQKGMIHRDIKPDNMMIDGAGNLKLADMGLAKNRLEGDNGMTVTGTVMGSPHWMSPEQVKESKNVDHRADLYSLGITFFQTLTGKVPYELDSAAEVCLAHLEKPLPSVALPDPALTEALDAIVARICAKDKDARFQNASEILATIEPWVGCNPVEQACQAFLGELPFESRRVGVQLEKAKIKSTEIDADLGSLAMDDDLSSDDPAPEQAGKPTTKESTSSSTPKQHRPRWKLTVAAGAVLLLGVAGWMYMTGKRVEPPIAPTEDNTLAAPQEPVTISPPAEGVTAGTISVSAPEATTPMGVIETLPSPAAQEIPPSPALEAPKPPTEAPVTPAPVPANGGLIVMTEPSGASVLLEGTSSPSPAFFDKISAGKHHLKVSLPGYEDHEEDVEIIEGEAKKLSLILKKIAPAPAP